MPQPVTPDAVTWAYRLFLGRDPESPSVVESQCTVHRDIESLRHAFLHSPEFQAQSAAIHGLTLNGSEPPMKIEAVQDITAMLEHIRRSWEQMGRERPHWSVLSDNQFLPDRIADSQKAFYASGAWNRDIFLAALRRNGVDPDRLSSCLEFGCGVGRVTSWLAAHFKKIFAVDISQPHLDLARRYLDGHKVRGVDLIRLQGIDDLDRLPQVDAVYSVIVLQHNPPPIIARVIQSFFARLAPGGCAYFQVPTYNSGYTFSERAYVAGEMRRSDMEMHVLPQAEIFRLAAQAGCEPLEVAEDGCTGLRTGERSNTFLFRKRSV